MKNGERQDEARRSITPEAVEQFGLRYREAVDDYVAFKAALTHRPRNTFRVNTIKAEIEPTVERMRGLGLTVTPLPWFDAAFAVEEEINLSGTLERFLGTIYIGEAASMLPPLVVAEELREARLVLDACAAPGSKTTLASAIMENRNVVVANDRSYGRIRALQFNVHKFGAINTIITSYELQAFPKASFDVILLDVPCSSTGTVRKSPKLIRSWDVSVSIGYAGRQKDLIGRAFDMLNPGGTLVYSTCSLAPEEDEGVVDFLLRNREAEVAKIMLPGFRFAPGIVSWQGREFDPRVAQCGRVWPHLNDTDGFFVAKVKRC